MREAVSGTPSPSRLHDVDMEDVRCVRELRVQWTQHKEKLRGMVELVDSAVTASCNEPIAVPADSPVFDDVFASSPRLASPHALTAAAPVASGSAARPTSTSAASPRVSIPSPVRLSVTPRQRPTEPHQLRAPHASAGPAETCFDSPDTTLEVALPLQQGLQRTDASTTPAFTPRRQSASPDRVRMAELMAHSGYWERHASPYLTPRSRGQQQQQQHHHHRHTTPRHTPGRQRQATPDQAQRRWGASPTRHHHHPHPEPQQQPTPERVAEERQRYHNGHSAVLSLAIKHAQKAFYKRGGTAPTPQRALPDAEGGSPTGQGGVVEQDELRDGGGGASGSPSSLGTPPSPGGSPRSEGSSGRRGATPQAQQRRRSERGGGGSRREGQGTLGGSSVGEPRPPFATYGTPGQAGRQRKAYALPQSALPSPAKARKLPRKLSPKGERGASLGSDVAGAAAVPLYPELHPVGRDEGELAGADDTIGDSNSDASFVPQTPPDDADAMGGAELPCVEGGEPSTPPAEPASPAELRSMSRDRTSSGRGTSSVTPQAAATATAAPNSEPARPAAPGPPSPTPSTPTPRAGSAQAGGGGGGATPPGGVETAAPRDTFANILIDIQRCESVQKSTADLVPHASPGAPKHRLSLADTPIRWTGPGGDAAFRHGSPSPSMDEAMGKTIPMGPDEAGPPTAAGTVSSAPSARTPSASNGRGAAVPPGVHAAVPHGAAGHPGHTKAQPVGSGFGVLPDPQQEAMRTAASTLAKRVGVGRGRGRGVPGAAPGVQAAGAHRHPVPQAHARPAAPEASPRRDGHIGSLKPSVAITVVKPEQRSPRRGAVVPEEEGDDDEGTDPDIYEGLVLSGVVLEAVSHGSAAAKAGAMKAAGMRLLFADGVPMPKPPDIARRMQAWKSGAITLGFTQLSLIVSETGRHTVDGVYCRAQLTPTDKSEMLHAKFVRLGSTTTTLEFYFIGFGLWRIKTLDSLNHQYSCDRLLGKWEKNASREPHQKAPYPRVSVPEESFYFLRRDSLKKPWHLKFTPDGTFVSCAPDYNSHLSPYFGMRLVRVDEDAFHPQLKLPNAAERETVGLTFISEAAIPTSHPSAGDVRQEGSPPAARKPDYRDFGRSRFPHLPHLQQQHQQQQQEDVDSEDDEEDEETDSEGRRGAGKKGGERKRARRKKKKKKKKKKGGGCCSAQ